VYAERGQVFAHHAAQGSSSTGYRKVHASPLQISHRAFLGAALWGIALDATLLYPKVVVSFCGYDISHFERLQQQRVSHSFAATKACALADRSAQGAAQLSTAGCAVGGWAKSRRVIGGVLVACGP
jgi:acetoin utilization deacetylase AcuC-like enzyme